MPGDDPGTTILAGTSTTEGNTTTTTTPFGVELQQAADKVTATITDATGAVVRTIDIGELKASVPVLLRMAARPTAPKRQTVLTKWQSVPAMALPSWWLSRCSFALVRGRH